MKTELEDRTKKFAIAIVRLVRTFPKTVDGVGIGRQILDSGTSVGANYREANRAESRKDFIHKVGVAEKEASETQYWLEICAEAPLGEQNEVNTIAQRSTRIACDPFNHWPKFPPMSAYLKSFRFPLSAFRFL